ncbi:MAG: chloride channel protein [Alistipes sp.]|jgi:CIC family chloride channel protein|nr:chloride channel protein [Alistipes sp.]
MSFADRLYRRFLRTVRTLNDRQMMMVLAVVVGLLAGVVTWIFELLLHTIREALTSWFNVESESYLYLIYPVVGVILVTLFVKYVVKDNISEGVTRVLYAMSKKSSRIKSHNMWTSVVGGATTIGFGGSVGPEAPIVLTGAAIGSNVGRALRLNYKQSTLLLCCGAGAAVAAIFKAPIAGLVFVLEILMLEMTAASIIPLLLATIGGTTLAFALRGFDPIIAVNVPELFVIRNIPMYALLGVACGLVAYYFASVNSAVARFFGRFDHVWQKWLVGGAVLGVLLFLFPPLYGEGYEALGELMHGRMDTLFENSLFYKYRAIPWVVIAFLLAALFLKVVATATTNAAGGVGGTFAPSLFVGAFTGGATAFVCNYMFGMELPLVSFTLVGMAGVMAGVMKAPLTSIFLIAELSNGYGLFIPLMITTAISFMIDYWLDPDSIYTKQLRQRGELLSHDKDASVMVFLHLDKLMETDFLPIGVGDTLGDAVKVISRARRNVFPVVDSGGVLVGIVQLDDMRVDMFRPEKYSTPVTAYMIQPPDRILPNEQVASVLSRFDETGTWTLPVVDKAGRYLGFLSKSRILASYREQLVEISQ